MIDLLGSITRLAVHAVSYRRGVRDSVTFHLGGLTASGKQIGHRCSKLGTQREQEGDGQNEDEIAWKETENGGVKLSWGSRVRSAPQKEERGILESRSLS